jgi:hypothetical protein
MFTLNFLTLWHKVCRDIEAFSKLVLLFLRLVNDLSSGKKTIQPDFRISAG